MNTKRRDNGDTGRTGTKGAPEDVQFKGVVKFHSALQLLLSHVESMTLSHAVSFLTVARYPGRSLRALSELAGIPQSTMSRHMLDLSQYTRVRKGSDGEGRAKGSSYGLIEVTLNPQSLREKVYNLSPKGRALVAIVATLLD